MRPFFFLVPLLFLLPSCRNDETPKDAEKEERRFFESAPETVPELGRNRLTNEPTDFLRSYQDSPINWQPWTPEVLDYAEKSQRLIFVFVGSHAHPISNSAARTLEREFAEDINSHYVPVLADIEVDPALALACNLLSIERREPVAFPFLIWLSHEGNPVAWLPIKVSEEEDLMLGFRRAQNTVETIVAKSMRYVVENSRHDNERRVGVFAPEIPEDPLELSTRGLFQSARILTGYYDPISNLFDRTGGLPPGYLLTTLARMAEHPACPERQANEMREACQQSVNTLVTSAIFDPLEGDFFMRRRSNTFSVPAITKHISTQSQMLSAIASVTPTPPVDFVERRLVEFLQNSPATAQSLLNEETGDDIYFWNPAEIEDTLTEEELKVFNKVFDIQPLGNIPSSDDPRRNFFRKNSLGLKVTPMQAADGLGMSADDTLAHFVSAISKLKARRDKKVEESRDRVFETTPTLADRARLLVAFCRSYARTREAETLANADALAKALQVNYRDSNGRLLRCPRTPGQREVIAFAGDYTSLIQALLEYYRLKWDPALIDLAKSLAKELLDHHSTEEGLIFEYPVKGQRLPFPVHNIDMIFGPSSWGDAFGALTRLTDLGFEHPNLDKTLASTSAVLQMSLARQPIVHTDFLHTALSDVSGQVLIISDQIPEATVAKLRLDLAQAEFDAVTVVPQEGISESLPRIVSEMALIVSRDGSVKKLDSAEAILPTLREVLSQN